MTKSNKKIDLNAVGALPTLSVASGQIQFDYAFDFIELDLGELTEKNSN
ncbi:hypothetical protein [Lactococcus fujiensis]|nr:hypothetical protein [Lactococcus fujiensis]